MCSFAFLLLPTRTQRCTFAVLTLTTQGVQTFGFIQYTDSGLHYQVKEVQITISSLYRISHGLRLFILLSCSKRSSVFEWKLDYFLSGNAFSEQTT